MRGQKKTKNFRVEVVTVTVELAKSWLEKGFGGDNKLKKNRNLNWRRIDKYAKDMKTGRWICNGATIKFDSRGFLLDGQHRLHAIIIANVDIDTAVAWNVPMNAALSIDVGGSRSTQVILSMAEEKNISMLNGTLQLINRYQQREDSIYTGNSSLGGVEALNNITVLDFLEDHPSVRTSCSKISGLTYLGKLISRASMAFLHYEISQQDRNLANEFMERASSGAGLQEGSPILALRQRLELVKDKKDKVGLAPQAGVYLAHAVKGWNYWIEGREVNLQGFSFIPARHKWPKIMKLSDVSGEAAAG